MKSATVLITIDEQKTNFTPRPKLRKLREKPVPN